MNNASACMVTASAIELSGAIHRPACGEPPALTDERVLAGGSSGR
jgi:hypothetical protein